MTLESTTTPTVDAEPALESAPSKTATPGSTATEIRFRVENTGAVGHPLGSLVIGDLLNRPKLQGPTLVSGQMGNLVRGAIRPQSTN